MATVMFLRLHTTQQSYLDTTLSIINLTKILFKTCMIATLEQKDVKRQYKTHFNLGNHGNHCVAYEYLPEVFITGGHFFGVIDASCIGSVTWASCRVVHHCCHDNRRVACSRHCDITSLKRFSLIKKNSLLPNK